MNVSSNAVATLSQRQRPLLFLCFITLICILSSPVFSANFVNAGPPVVNIEQIGKHQLSNTSQIIQDSLGFIWLVKDDGLFRYDSKQLKQFPGLEQFSTDQIANVTEGQPGHLWIATKNNGLAHFDTYSTRLTFYDLEQTFGLTESDNKVDQLVYKNNTLHLASSNQLLFIHM